MSESESLVGTHASETGSVNGEGGRTRRWSARTRTLVVVGVLLGLVCAAFVVCALVELVRVRRDPAFARRTFVLLSDVHTDPLSQPVTRNQSTWCRDPAAARARGLAAFPGAAEPQYVLRVRPGGRYGRYGCDAPKALAAAAYDAMAAAAAQLRHAPEFVLHGGDAAAHALDAAGVVDAFEHTHAQLAARFPRARVVPAVGNNDVVPHYDAACDSPALATLAGLWRRYGWLDADQEAFFRHAGAHAADATADGLVRVLALNANIFLARGRRPANQSTADDCGQLAWLDAELARAAQRGQTVLVLMHVAPVVDNYDKKDLWANATVAQAFRDTLARHNAAHPGLVQAVVMGHVHKDEYRLLRRPDGSTLLPVIVAPAVSPVFDNNPAFRIVYFSAENAPATSGNSSGGKGKHKVAVLRDYDQYYMDLRASYTTNTTQWVREYRFSTAYGRRSLQTDEFDRLHADLGTHSALMTEYMTRYASHYTTDEKTTLCAYQSNTADEYQQCVAQWS